MATDFRWITLKANRFHPAPPNDGIGPDANPGWSGNRGCESSSHLGRHRDRRGLNGCHGSDVDRQAVTDGMGGRPITGACGSREIVD